MKSLKTLVGLDIKDPVLGIGTITNVYFDGKVKIAFVFPNGNRPIVSSDQVGTGKALRPRDLVKLDPAIQREINEPGINQRLLEVEAGRKAQEALEFKRRKQRHEQEELKRSIEQVIRDLQPVSTQADLLANAELFRALKRIHGNGEPDDREVEVLDSAKEFRVLAKAFERLFESRRDPWLAVKACRRWRKCGRADRTLELSGLVLDGDWPHRDDRTRLCAAAKTTRGGAYKDQGEFNQAITLAKEAMKLRKLDHQPHNLLGGVYLRLRDLGRFEYHFGEACRLDRKCTNPKKKVELEILETKAYDADGASRFARWLVDQDENKYGWAKKYF